MSSELAIYVCQSDTRIILVLFENMADHEGCDHGLTDAWHSDAHQYSVLSIKPTFKVLGVKKPLSDTWLSLPRELILLVGVVDLGRTNPVQDRLTLGIYYLQILAFVQPFDTCLSIFDDRVRMAQDFGIKFSEFPLQQSQRC